MSLQVDRACLARQLVGSDYSIHNPPNGGNSDSESNLERLIVDNETQAGRLCLFRSERDLRCRCRGNRNLPILPRFKVFWRAPQSGNSPFGGRPGRAEPGARMIQSGSSPSPGTKTKSLLNFLGKRASRGRILSHRNIPPTCQLIRTVARAGNWTSGHSEAIILLNFSRVVR
jgi:hypothetical protein